jgi:pimeloyl-ACP methyl ester carboxylesterase
MSSPKIPKRSKLFYVLLSLVIAYLFVVLLVLIFQRRLIYFPTRFPADMIESVAKDHGFLPWKNAGGQIIGWKITAKEVSTSSILILHGNAGCALDRDYIAQPIHAAADVDVFVLEYPGYGARKGSPTKANMDAAAEEAFQLLPSGKPKYLVSESIGTGVACDLVKDHPSEVAGLALFVPYHNLASVAQQKMWLLPAYCLLLDRFNPEECLKNYRGPVKFIVASNDEILGPATGKKLADSYLGPKELLVVPGAHHNDVSAQSPEWWREVFTFLKNNPPRTGK